MQPPTLTRCLLLLLVILLSSSAAASEWPAHRRDARRSAITPEQLTFPLRRAWTVHCAQPPRPAWPPQPKLLNRTDYDYAAQLVAADGLVVFGSSADDAVRALDLATGRERWRFTAGGPVRLAPQIHAGHVYFASDDGRVYCLTTEGKLVWTFQAAPWNDMMIGNGRMISRWPCRTGVLVVGDTLYTTAGFWPADGIYVYALDAATGAVRWVNDTLGFMGKGFQDTLDGNHQGEFIFVALNPEGPLLADRGVLLVPQGHSNPLRLDMQTGQPVGRSEDARQGMDHADRYVRRLQESGKPLPPPEHLARAKAGLARRGFGRPGSGGTWLTIDGGFYYALAMHRNRRIYLNAWDLRSNEPWQNRHSDKAIPQLALGLYRTVLPGRVSVLIRDRKIIARNAFDLALAGEALLVGAADRVSAFPVDGGQPIWEAPARGEVRSIAVADGRLLISTTTGEIACFTSDAAEPLTHEPPRPDPESLPTAGDRRILAALQEHGANQGYMLLLGDTTGRLARMVVGRTGLHVIVALTDTEAVRALRADLLRGTRLYGSRIHVVHLAEPRRLPFAQFFANTVVAPDGPGEVPPAELRRVLRPCGGLLLEGEAPPFIRTQLPEANDCDHRVPDPLVKWPLQALWHGGPPPSLLADHRSGEEVADPPVVAWGRCFVLGEDCLTAYDAYNGTVLWTRPLPKLWANVREYGGVLRTVQAVDPVKLPDKHWRILLARRLRASRDHVYLTLGEGYLRGRDEAIVQLDARTGRQLRFMGPVVTGPALSLAESRTWLLEFPERARKSAPKVGQPLRPRAEDAPLPARQPAAVPSPAAGRARMTPGSGLLSLRAEPEHLAIELETRDVTITPLDLWELCFDFRPPDQRCGLLGPGAFTVLIVPPSTAGAPRVVPGFGTAWPVFEAVGKRTETGAAMRLRLAWSEVEKLVGARPKSFAFAAVLNDHDGSEDPSVPIRQRHLFSDGRSVGMHAGWAQIYLGPAPETPPVPTVAQPLPPEERPHDWMSPAALQAPWLQERFVDRKRLHPLSGEPGPLIFRSGSWGCGGACYSATSVFRRPSKPAIGVYDFEDDSGLRFLQGISMPCGNSSIAALGLLLYRDCRFRCDCNPPIKTSVAFAPAERRYNEDWALFFDHPVTSRVRHAFLNFGAFGDRRDDVHRLWLAVPRDVDSAYGYAVLPGRRGRRVALHQTEGVYIRHEPAGLLVPVELDYLDAAGPWRRNADRTVVAGTDCPWLYASGVAGIRKIRMQLDFMTPLHAAPAAAPVAVDGRLDEPAWAGKPTATLPNTGARIRLRSDEANLYIGVEREALVDRRGRVFPWSKKTRGKDAAVWTDDALEVFLSSAGAPVVHVAVSASGARFDARTVPGAGQDKAWDIPWQSAVVADAKRLSFELAIPRHALAEAGLDIERLGINLMIDQSDTRADREMFPGGEGRNWNLKTPTSEALHSLGGGGRARCSNFAPLGFDRAPDWPLRRYTLRLHFAQLEPARRPGVFTVRVQGRPAIESVDIAREAGGLRRALVRELTGIQARDTLTIELLPQRPGASYSLCALELRDESFAPPPLASERP